MGWPVRTEMTGFTEMTGSSRKTGFTGFTGFTGWQGAELPRTSLFAEYLQLPGERHPENPANQRNPENPVSPACLQHTARNHDEIRPRLVPDRAGPLPVNIAAEPSPRSRPTSGSRRTPRRSDSHPRTSRRTVRRADRPRWHPAGA